MVCYVSVSATENITAYENKNYANWLDYLFTKLFFAISHLQMKFQTVFIYQNSYNDQLKRKIVGVGKQIKFHSKLAIIY